jgi:PadR family transcriptional regulator PadR
MEVGVEANNGELVQGTLEMLVLKALALESMHGYGLALRIEQISGGVFKVNPGSLLPALSRMERSGRVRGEWRSTENNRRAKYYKLTADGRKALEQQRRLVGPPNHRYQSNSRGLKEGEKCCGA